MKINLTVVLTFLLLIMMFGAGGVSAKWGLSLGKQALKEITQPEISPTRNRGEIQEGLGRREGIIFAKEDKIIEKVKAQMEGKAPASTPEPKDQKKTDTESTTAAKETEESKKKESKAQESKTEEAKPQESKADDNFPIVNKDQDVTMQVLGVEQQGGSILLKVSLKNDSPRSVQFLYSFLNVTDNQGRALSASTQELPGELPPDGQTYTGTVSIPTSLLENAQKVSISLTDYPDQQLQLQLRDIPVKQ